MRHPISLALLLCLATPLSAQDRDNPLEPSPTWDDLRAVVIGDVTPTDGAGLLALDAPYRAEDAATVPLHITQTGETPVDDAIVVIDENPAPVAATFDFGPDMAPLDFELRVRVNQYSNVRVLTETDAGTAMVGRFVKASGGCSAPASRDPEVALADMGEMRLRGFEADGPLQNTPRREAQIMIRHPNYSGLQRDQVTHLFIGAHFIDTIEVFQGDEPLWSMTGGISISENPVFRFFYDDNGSTDLKVRATDTEGNVFEQILPKGAAT